MHDQNTIKSIHPGKENVLSRRGDIQSFKKNENNKRGIGTRVREYASSNTKHQSNVQCSSVLDTLPENRAAMMRSRKGFIGDTLTWALILFALVLVVFFSVNMVSDMDEAFQSSGLTDRAIEESARAADGWPKWWDTAIAIFVGLMYIVTLALAWQIGTNPAFFWISLILFIFIMMFIVMMHNMLGGIVNEETFVETKAAMPFTGFLVDNFFMVLLAGGILLLIVLFAKVRSEA